MHELLRHILPGAVPAPHLPASYILQNQRSMKTSIIYNIMIQFHYAAKHLYASANEADPCFAEVLI